MASVHTAWRLARGCSRVCSRGALQPRARVTPAVTPTCLEGERNLTTAATSSAPPPPPLRRSPFGHNVNALQDGVVVPLPGMLLTQELFKASDLEGAFEGYASAVDMELGESTILTAHSVKQAAESIVEGLERRHGGAMGVLIGHSYGGYVALEVARKAPQWVAGLVLMSTQNPPDTAGAAARRRKQVELAKAAGMRKFIDGLLPALLSPDAQEDEEIIHSVRRMADQTGVARLEQQMNSTIARPDQRSTVQQLNASIPVLLISGSKDKLIPPRCASQLASELKARDAAAIQKGCRTAPWAVRSHKESGHLLALEKPEALHFYLRSWADEVNAVCSLQPCI